MSDLLFYNLHTATELWRLRLNFIVLVVFNFVQGIGETSTLSTFHQFITNPQEQGLNDTESVSVHKISTQLANWVSVAIRLDSLVPMQAFNINWQ